jgi:hypothetical protein
LQRHGVFSLSVMSAFGYLAIEPWVRRYWPQTMITWSRFLAGRWQDPVVGRDVLLGVVWAIVHTLLQRVVSAAELWLGETPARPIATAVDWGVALETLMGSRAVIAELVRSCIWGFTTAAQFCFVLLFFRAWLRKPWLAVVSCFILFFVASQGDRSHLAFDSISISIAILVLLRHGLLAMTVFASVMSFTDTALLTVDFTEWYGHGSLAAVIVVSTLAAWAFRISLDGRPLFATKWLDH